MQNADANFQADEVSELRSREPFILFDQLYEMYFIVKVYVKIYIKQNFKEKLLPRVKRKETA
jgi:hypothetical protein